MHNRHRLQSKRAFFVRFAFRCSSVHFVHSSKSAADDQRSVRITNNALGLLGFFYLYEFEFYWRCAAED